MSVSARLDQFLNERDVHYCVHRHPHSRTSLESARAAQVPAHNVAKAVILHDDEGYLMAVIPADQRLNISRVNRYLSRHLFLADEPELCALFNDCEAGAVPALADAYAMEAVWDDELSEAESVFIEAGDHDRLLEIPGADFRRLMYADPHERITARQSGPAARV